MGAFTESCGGGDADESVRIGADCNGVPRNWGGGQWHKSTEIGSRRAAGWVRFSDGLGSNAVGAV